MIKVLKLQHHDNGLSSRCRWEHLIYQLGGHQDLIRSVVIEGRVVHDNHQTLDL